MNATPTLEMLDPATLTVDINVRKDAALTPDFVASIAEHGVMEPVIAHRKDDGVLHVLMGQRRTRAAVEAGSASIPVLIIESPEEAERIVTQVVENIQRAELTEADEAEAYHQLSLIGVSAAMIAKKTGRTKTTVESALKAKSTDAGSAALGKGYTIEAALILAEFELDEDAVEELESVIADEPDMLAHVAQQLRDRRDRAAALAALTGLPPSLPLALARCSLAASLGRDADVVEDTEGLLNGDDLSAALLLLRARSLRRLGANAAARAALQEVLRRRKTDLTLRGDALTDRALLLLDDGRRALNRRDWQHRPPADLETVRAIRKDAELHELWDREYGQADGE